RQVQFRALQPALPPLQKAKPLDLQEPSALPPTDERGHPGHRLVHQGLQDQQASPQPSQEVLECRASQALREQKLLLQGPSQELSLLEPSQEERQEYSQPTLRVSQELLEHSQGPLAHSLGLLGPRHPIRGHPGPIPGLLGPRHPIRGHPGPIPEYLGPRHPIRGHPGPILEYLELILGFLGPTGLSHPTLGLPGPSLGPPGPSHPTPGPPGPSHPTPGPPGPSLGPPGPSHPTPGPSHPTPGLPGPSLGLPGPSHPTPGLPGPSLGPPGPSHPTPGLPGPSHPTLGLPGPSLGPPGPSLGLPGPSHPTPGPPGPSHPTPGLPGPSLGLPGPSHPTPGLPGPSHPTPGPPGPSLELLRLREVILPGDPGAQGVSPGAEAGIPEAQPIVPWPTPFYPRAQLGWPDARAGFFGQPAFPWTAPLGYEPSTPLALPAAGQLAVPPGPVLGATPPTSPLLSSATPIQDAETPSSGSSLAPARYADTVDALRSLAQLTDLCFSLREQIGLLDQYKCSHADLRRLQDFLTDALYRSFTLIPPDLPERLAAMKAMEDDLKTEKEKLSKIQKVIEGEVEPMSTAEKVEGAGQINMQIGYLRATVQDIEKELKELRSKQELGKATLEQSVTDTAFYLQEQLDKLRSVIENMMNSSSALLSMSMPPTPEPGLAQVQGTCAACSLDVSEKVSQLFKRYEQLQDSINNFMLRQAEGKLAKKPKHRQDEEMLSQIQNTILQVQDECEKLNSTTGSLIEDHRQKQKEISMLFKSLEKLENQKADKDHIVMEIDVKADKTALAAKVSRSQFDATTEQLHKMMQELLNKMAGQEQDWQKVLDKLLIEMDSKETLSSFPLHFL
ncbi:Glutamine-rich protein 2, partial [Varanus komodoensis]